MPTDETTADTATTGDVKAKKRRNVIRVQAPAKLMALAQLTGETPEAMAERMLAAQVEIAASAVAGQAKA